MDYSYLFDSEKIYSENIISFYNLFSYNNIHDFINPSITENDFFLYLIYPNNKLVKELMQRDELIRFRFIDFFANNINMIEQRDRKIQEFLMKNDLNYLDSVYTFLKKDLDVPKLNYLKPVIEDIATNKDIYLQYILSQIWYKNSYKIINIEHLTIRLMILYYFNIFMIKERTQELKIESPDYVEFVKLLVKYKSLYNVNQDYTSIIFKTIDDQNISSSRNFENEQEVMDEKRKMILDFFDQLTNPILIDQKVISWFYIFFASYIPKELHNELLYIILGFKKNTIGFVTQIIKSYGKNYSEFTEEEKEDIVESIKNDYIFKQNEIIANEQDIKNYMNNIILLDKYNNTEEKFKLLSGIDENKIKPEKLFFILSYDPLKESWQSIENKINKTEFKFQNLDIEIKRLIQIFNSVQLTDFSKKDINIISSNGRYRLVPFKLIVEKLNTFDNMVRQDLNAFDQDILFYNFLLFLNNFEIVLFNTETTLLNVITKYNTDINTIKQIFHSIYPLKDFYNGYKRFK